MTTAKVYPEKRASVFSVAAFRVSDLNVCLSLLILSAIVTFVVHPRIGVRDIDAHCYIEGAYSIQAGNGYRELNGEPLNHYPPGYSLILSLFSSPLLAALILNYLCLGVSIVLIYYLARFCGKWDVLPALGLALAIGFIFLSRHATNAGADILTYALFFLAFLLYYAGSPRLRLMSYVVWGIAIPIKLIAIIFIPAAVITRYLGKPASVIWAEKFELVSANLIWGLFTLVALSYNFLTIKTALPQTHTQRTSRPFTDSVLQFLATIPRTFLSNWYGSLSHASALISFGVVLLLALVCLGTLRLKSRQIAWHAALLILLSVLLQFAGRQIGGARLAGYGFITLFLAFRPIKPWNKVWILYGLLGVFLSVFNGLSQNSMGANDPRYEEVAKEALKIEAFPQNVPTNSFRILDLHAKLLTKYTSSAEELRSSEYFFWVSLPKYDAISTTVAPLEEPGTEWCEIASLTGARLYRRCQQNGELREK